MGRIIKAMQRDMLIRQREICRQIRREAKASRTQRTLDTRRKILIGAAVMGAMERGDFSQDAIYQLLDRILVRPVDRELFGLPSRCEE